VGGQQRQDPQLGGGEGRAADALPSDPLDLGPQLVGLLWQHAEVGPLASLVVVPAYLAELFPTPVRSTALAISYGLGTALFGGTAPFLATVLVRRTGSTVAPAIYAVAVAVVAVAAAVAARETAFQPLDTADLPEAELARPGR